MTASEYFYTELFGNHITAWILVYLYILRVFVDNKIMLLQIIS